MFGSVSKSIKLQSIGTHLIVNLKDKDQIHEQQLQFLNQNKDMGFLNVRWEKNAAGNMLRYDVSNLVSCLEYVQQPRTLEEYFGLIYQFQQIMDFCEKSNLPYDCLVAAEPKDTYCDPQTHRLYVAFVPLVDARCTCFYPLQFLRDLHKQSNLIVTDSNTLLRYQEFLAMSMHLPKGIPINGTTSISAQLLAFLMQNNLVPTSKSTVAPTQISGATENPKVTDDASPYLTDAEQNQIVMDHFPFTIGRKRTNDLVIPITTVSGFHATILERNGRYYLQDNHSGNGTYLNNKDVQQTGDSELHTGDVIYIYNIPLRFTAPTIKCRAVFDSGNSQQDVPFYSPETTDLSRYLAQTETVDATESSIAPMVEHVKPMEAEASETPEIPQEEPSAPAVSAVQPPALEIPTDDETTQGSGFVGSIAYLVNNATKERMPIYEYPFTCSELMEMRILQETFGEHHETVIENINCDDLAVERCELGENERIRLFSGGTFLYHGVSYSFYAES